MKRLARWTLCLLLLLAACRASGATRPTVKIGLVAPFEGRYRYVGYGLFAAVRLALREANAAGGGGTPPYSVELVAYDDGADPEMARQQGGEMAVGRPPRAWPTASRGCGGPPPPPAALASRGASRAAAKRP